MASTLMMVQNVASSTLGRSSLHYHRHRRSLTDPGRLSILEESIFAVSEFDGLQSAGCLATNAGIMNRCQRFRSVSDSAEFFVAFQPLEELQLDVAATAISENNNMTIIDDKTLHETMPTNQRRRRGRSANVAASVAENATSSLETISAFAGNEHRPPTHEDFLSALLDEEWTTVESMLEVDPQLARRCVPLTLQGEDTSVHPLAAVAASSSRSLHGGVPLSLFETLVTINPVALIRGDARGNRVPVMIALMTLPGGTRTDDSKEDDSVTISTRAADVSMAKTKCIRYLFQAWSPNVLHHLDAHGNVALHYAAQYCCSISCGCCRYTGLASECPPKRLLILEEMLLGYREAAQLANSKQQLPLHLLVAAAVAADRGNGENVSLCCNKCTIRCLEVLIEAYPQALQKKDRQGRLPLHVACASSSHPSWDVLQVLIQNYPAALLSEDATSGKLPLELWMMMSPLRTGMSGPVTSLSLRSNQRRKARKRALGAVLPSTSSNGDNDVVFAYLQECTRREQDKKHLEQQPQQRFLGRVLSGLRGGGPVGATNGRKKDSAILAVFNNCYG